MRYGLVVRSDFAETIDFFAKTTKLKIKKDDFRVHVEKFRAVSMPRVGNVDRVTCQV